MATFVYIDYGPSPDIAIELQYSVATLFEEYAGREPDVVVYTDKPSVYAGLHPKLTARPFGAELANWSRDGLYGHRVKPTALLDALRNIDAQCVLVDTDTFFRPGFAGAVGAALAAGGAAMDHFERDDPCPACAGIEVATPNSGRYAYDPATARMYNSGLVAVSRERHAPMLQDALALIDGWLDAGVRQFNIEQIAVSEAFRLHEEPIAEMKPWFEHYYRRSQKSYMRPRIRRWLRDRPALGAQAPFLEPSKFRVRFAHAMERIAFR
jgi:hypothetical protein